MSEPGALRTDLLERVAHRGRADAVRAFCDRWKIVELSLFGSALRDDFDARSDVDLLVTFAPPTPAGTSWT